METSKESQRKNIVVNGSENTNILTKQKMSGKKVALIALGCVIAFIALIIAIANISTSAPLKVSDELMSYIKDNKPNEGYALMTSEAKATISASDFAKTFDKISPYLTGTPVVQNKEINTSSDSGTTAQIVYEVKGSDATYTFTVNLREVNGKWLIDSFESKVKK